MVMFLPPPATCSQQLVHDVVTESGGGPNEVFFKGVHAEWLTRVQNYIAEQGAPQTVSTWPAADARKSLFHKLYSSPAAGSASKKALENLRAHELAMCPGCGDAGVPNTLDHYLPKGKYPHFAVTPLNLSPMCSACQSKKATKTGDAANPRFFIHPYFDAFAAQQLLFLTFHAPFEAPSFALSVAPGLTPAQEALVRVHVRELGIEARFKKFFAGQHRRLLRRVGEMRASGQDVAATISEFRQMYALKGLNEWNHIYYAGVLADAALMTYLLHAPLPPRL